MKCVACRRSLPLHAWTGASSFELLPASSSLRNLPRLSHDERTVVRSMRLRWYIMCPSFRIWRCFPRPLRQVRLKCSVLEFEASNEVWYTFALTYYSSKSHMLYFHISHSQPSPFIDISDRPSQLQPWPQPPPQQPSAQPLQHQPSVGRSSPYRLIDSVTQT